ncbi:hypothetical protein MMAN_26660 [Mycobacterium mantenii]|uniref:Uncharacterized protein n=1 Tax=Mycobacterium mantenii TaxID=560555 RepID=A0ABM7JSK0_MYCNT|nr:hypothetical protein MMAN_26660 [Mycobacterium mantenii]
MFGKVDYVIDTVQCVVSIDEQRCAGIEAGECIKCVQFVIEGLNEAVSHRAERRDSVLAGRKQIRRARYAGEVAGPCDLATNGARFPNVKKSGFSLAASDGFITSTHFCCVGISLILLRSGRKA